METCSSKTVSVEESGQPDDRPVPVLLNDRDAELPKLWNIEDPFQYAPPTSTEDPWTLLLEPLLKNDKMRCEAWKDEVHNLLIFAGLFSAVVTTFIVESYKDLQPDTNVALINLLAHIATRLDGQSNFTTIGLPVLKPLSPPASALRVNAFWFISLVLSLTTVLVGIISLQWLREHQSYPNLTSREAYALFNMRAESLKKWQVDKIFTAMPLLLQCALVLFLGGVIDFLRTFQQWAVIIPVAVVIGLPLSFLVATTILPTLQTFSLYINFTRQRDCHPSKWPMAPSQCPFRSPQSHAISKLFRPLFKLSHYLLRSYKFRSFVFGITHPFSNPPSNFWRPHADNFTSYIYSASLVQNWIDFDRSWLVIRDGYMRRALGRSIWYEYVGESISDQVPPIYDLVEALNVQKGQEPTDSSAKSMAAISYHCLSALSGETLFPLLQPTNAMGFASSRAERLRQNDYLYDLLSFGEDCSISDFLNIDTCMQEAEKGDLTSTKALASILHQQNLLAHTSCSESLSTHRKELAVRFFRHFYDGRHKINLSNDKIKLSECLSFIPFDQKYKMRFRDTDLLDDDAFDALAWQLTNLTLSIFRQLSEEFHPHSLVHSSFAQVVGLPLYMEVAGYVTSKVLSSDASGQTPSSSTVNGTTAMTHDVLQFINESLNQEMASWPNNEGQPSLLFYLATSCLHQVFINSTTKLTSLRETTLRYKKRTIDLGKVDDVIEKRLLTDYYKRPRHYESCLFSPDWWCAFDNLTEG